MTSWVTDFLDRIETSETLSDIESLVRGLRDTLGVEHAIYHIVGESGREYGALTYDPAWVDHYISNRYYRIDPVVTQSLRSTGPLDWRTLDWTGADARRLIGEAVNEGVGKQGYSIPIRGVNGQFALFTVTSFDRDGHWDRFGKAELRNLLLAAHTIHQRAAEIMGTDRLDMGPELSPRERDVLAHLATGRSRGETAATLGISEHTLRAYIDSARVKLGAVNTTHAVALGLTRGLILP